MAARHAEIAGAGLSGLMAATRLAQLGWSVRLHERGSELRMFGAGIWLWENGLRSLEAAGALDAAVARAQVIKEWRIADEHGRTLFSRPMTARRPTATAAARRPVRGADPARRETRRGHRDQLDRGGGQPGRSARA